MLEKTETVEKRLCNICKELKSKALFPLHRKICITCRNFKKSNSFKARNKTLSGKLKNTYKKIKDRCGKYEGYEHVTCDFTLDEFINFGLNNKTYLKLFRAWVKSDYQYAITPSVDRIDSKKNYTLDNIQFLTHRDNSTKDKKKARSKYVGVFFFPRSNKWKAQTYHKGKTIRIGIFKTELEAAKAVNTQCLKLGLAPKNFLNKT